MRLLTNLERGARTGSVVCLFVTMCVCLALSLSALPTFAQETQESQEGAVPEWAEEGRNEIGLYLGFTTREGDTGLSVGLDYEYRLNLRFGVGGVLEFTGADFREGLAVVAGYWHPWRELKLIVAPGVNVEPAAKTGEVVVRVGAEYAFPAWPRYEIAPALYFDIDDEGVSIVVGGSLTTHF